MLKEASTYGPSRRLSKFGAGRMVDDDGTAVGEGFDGMASIAGNDGNNAWSRDLRDAVDGDFEFAFDYFVDFFLRMGMLVDGRAFRKIVVREGHVRRMKVASVPAGEALDGAEGVRIDERQGNSRRQSRVKS
jgi:hypothetical protein